MGITVSVNVAINDAVIAELAKAPEMMGALRGCAEQISFLAQSYAPNHVAPTIELLGEDDGVVYVGSAFSFAHLWEFGSIRTPTIGFMRRAAADIADTFEES